MTAACVESVYCEPRDVAPYATSEDSDKDSVRSTDMAASGRYRGRPRDWRARQSIPLPPKPDEPVPRTSPPPPYYPTRPLPPPVPAPRPHGYVNEDPASCYFQPLSDEEARLVQTTQAADNPAFEAENVYLEGRRDDGDGDGDGDGAETIELRDLSVLVEATEEPGAEQVATTDQRDVVYAIRRESPTELTT